MGEFFKELHLVETKNTGIPKAIRVVKKNGSPMLEFEMDDDRTYFTVIIPIHEEFKNAE